MTSEENLVGEIAAEHDLDRNPDINASPEKIGKRQKKKMKRKIKIAEKNGGTSDFALQMTNEENQVAGIADEQDLDRNPDINVCLRQKEDPEKIGKQQEKKSRRNTRMFSKDIFPEETSLFVHYKGQRPPPDVIRKLHPKIIDLFVARSQNSRFCIIAFENPESTLAAKHDLDQNPDISVCLRSQKNKADSENSGKQQEKKLKRKIKITEKNLGTSDFALQMINEENQVAEISAKQDLNRNPDINVSLKRKEDPEKIGKGQEKKLKRKIKIAVKNAGTSDEFDSEKPSLFVSYPHQKRPLPDVIRKLHPKIIDVRVPRSKRAKFCFIEFENPESALAAKHDLNSNPDILVSLRRKDNPENPEKIAKRQEKKLKRKIMKAEKNSEDPPQKKSKPNPVKKSMVHSSKKKSSTPKVGSSYSETESVEELPPVDPSCLYLKGLPLMASQEILQNLFPQSSKIEIRAKKVNNKRCGLVYFASEKEAAEALDSSSGINVNGETLTIVRCLDRQ